MSRCRLTPPGRPPPTRDIDVLTYTGDPVKRRLRLHPRGLGARAPRRRDAGRRRHRSRRRSRRPGSRFAGQPGARRRTARWSAGRACSWPRPGPRGLRDRAARGARRRLHAGHDAAPGPYPALELARGLDPRLVERRPGGRACGRRSTSRCPDTRSAPSELLGAVPPREPSTPRSGSACCRDCCQDWGRS